jgi:hypothetical protein
MKLRTLFRKTLSIIDFLPVDLGDKDVSIILAGMGRSGTTWTGNIINYDNSYRVLFEPFLPTKVKEAKKFEYIQYLSPDNNNIELINQAKKILSGEIKNYWVDRDNWRLYYRHRIVKDIRCNLMLGWLKKVANDPPIVLMIRHPLQVMMSWKKLGWGKEAFGTRTEFDIITNQESLLNDFPIIHEIMKQIDKDDYIQNIVFQWCVYHYVPSEHLKINEAYALYYENLLTSKNEEIIKLFEYLKKSPDLYMIEENMRKESSTNFQKRNYSRDNTLNSWRNELTTKQISKSNKILEAFGLDKLYDKNGYPTGACIFKDR